MVEVEKQAVVVAMGKGECDAGREERSAVYGMAVGRALESIVSVLGAAMVELMKEWRVNQTVEEEENVKWMSIIK